MKIVIVEVGINNSGVDDTIKTTVLDSTFTTSWNKGLVYHEISDFVLNVLKEQGCWGWLEGVDRFGDTVLRNYALIPECVVDIDNWNK